MLITPTVDLTPFVGVRVKVTRTVAVERGQTIRYPHFGVFESLWHSRELARPIVDRPYCGGMLLEESHGDCHGGLTGFDLPYGDADVELAPLIDQS